MIKSWEWTASVKEKTTGKGKKIDGKKWSISKLEWSREWLDAICFYRLVRVRQTSLRHYIVTFLNDDSNDDSYEEKRVTLSSARLFKTDWHVHIRRCYVSARRVQHIFLIGYSPSITIKIRVMITFSSSSSPLLFHFLGRRYASRACFGKGHSKVVNHRHLDFLSYQMLYISFFLIQLHEHSCSDQVNLSLYGSIVGWKMKRMWWRSKNILHWDIANELKVINR